MGMVGLSDTFIHTSNHPTLTKQHAPPLFREGVGVTGSNDMTWDEMTQQHEVKVALASHPISQSTVTVPERTRLHYGRMIYSQQSLIAAV